MTGSQILISTFLLTIISAVSILRYAGRDLARISILQTVFPSQTTGRMDTEGAQRRWEPRPAGICLISFSLSLS